MFPRSYDIKKNTHTHTHKIFKDCLLSSDWSGHKGHSLLEIQREKVFVPYNLLWLRIFLFCVTLWIWHSDKKLHPEARAWNKFWHQYSLPDPMRRCTLDAHRTTQKGFLVQVHQHTEQLHAASRIPASLSIWTVFAGYSSPLKELQ